jgi:hypothetical protein
MPFETIGAIKKARQIGNICSTYGKLILLYEVNAVATDINGNSVFYRNGIIKHDNETIQISIKIKEVTCLSDFFIFNNKNCSYS